MLPSVWSTFRLDTEEQDTHAAQSQQDTKGFMVTRILVTTPMRDLT